MLKMIIFAIKNKLTNLISNNVRIEYILAYTGQTTRQGVSHKLYTALFKIKLYNLTIVSFKIIGNDYYEIQSKIDHKASNDSLIALTEVIDSFTGYNNG